MSEQQQQQQVPRRKSFVRNLMTALRYWLKLFHARRDPTTFKQVVEDMAQVGGVPAQDTPVVHNALIAVREGTQQAKQSAFVDLYLVGGMGALDLILLPILLTTGTSDAALAAALFLLVLSLPLTAMSLFFKFIKQKYNIATYGRIHSTLSFFALVTGAGALDGAIWHVSRAAGIVFLCLATLMYLWAVFYLVLIHIALRFNALQKLPEADKPAAPDASTS